MQSNKLRLAIRATAAAAVFSVAGQANAIELNAGDYKANLYGFARFAAAYDIDHRVGTLGGESASFSDVYNNDGGAEGHFGMDANTSRLGLSVMSPEDVKIVIEMDFDNSNGLDPRLRQAYGEYNGVLAGQAWSNFSSFVGLTSTLDFDSYPKAGVQSRIAQLRYTTGPLSFSVEEARGSLLGGTQVQSTPAFTARLEDKAGGISYSAAAMAKQNTTDDGTNDDSAFGYAGFLMGKIAVSDAVSIQANIGYADGATQYLYRAGGNFGAADAYVDGGDVETIEAIAGGIGASINVGSGTVNVGYGFGMADLEDADAAGAAVAGVNEENTMIAINYKWSPVKNVSMGVEFANLSAERVDGSDADANRLMYLAQYNF